MSKKRETVWRERLVKKFKENHPTAFIWVNGSLFKRGLPDLTLILGGVCTFLELKVVERRSHDPLRGLDPIQLRVGRQIAQAGGRAVVLTLAWKDEFVGITNLAEDMQTLWVPASDFENTHWRAPALL